MRGTGVGKERAASLKKTNTSTIQRSESRALVGATEGPVGLKHTGAAHNHKHPGVDQDSGV